MSDDDLVAAIESLPGADPDSVVHHDDGTARYVYNADFGEHDIDEIDERLADAGYERAGHVSCLIVDQDLRPLEDEEGGE